jgi:phosphomevalonate kinase
LRFSASAPGKLVVLGEYAVLDGAPALVMAVSRRCRATIAPASGSACRLRTRAAGEATLDFARGIKSGSALVDVLTSRWPTPARAFEADLDSTEFHAAGVKLGLGSSAAALVAFAGAYSAYLRADGQPEPDLTPAALIDAHRAFQGGAGSGLDVAAALTGGVIEYCLDPLGMPHIGSVRLPNSVGFSSSPGWPYRRAYGRRTRQASRTRSTNGPSSRPPRGRPSGAMWRATRTTSSRMG